MPDGAWYAPSLTDPGEAGVAPSSLPSRRIADLEAALGQTLNARP